MSFGPPPPLSKRVFDKYDKDKSGTIDAKVRRIALLSSDARAKTFFVDVVDFRRRFKHTPKTVGFNAGIQISLLRVGLHVE